MCVILVMESSIYVLRTFTAYGTSIIIKHQNMHYAMALFTYGPCLDVQQYWQYMVQSDIANFGI